MLTSSYATQFQAFAAMDTEIRKLIPDPPKDVNERGALASEVQRVADLANLYATMLRMLP